MDILTALSRADELYRLRGEPGAVKRSVEIVSALHYASDNYELQWRLARALFFLGQESSSPGAQQQLHAAGAGAGERAVSLNSERVEGHFWLGVNLALFAESAGGLRAARALLRAAGALERAAAVSPEYHAAGPYRVLGRLKHKAPWFLGGSRKASRRYFDLALEIAPANSVTLIYAAELAADTGERERAVAFLERITAAPIDPLWEFENRRDRVLAQGMLARLTGG